MNARLILTLLVGISIGWLGTQVITKAKPGGELNAGPAEPEIKESTELKSAVDEMVKRRGMKDSGKLPSTVTAKSPPPLDASLANIVDVLSRMKISQIRQVCDQATDQFKRNLISKYAPAIGEIGAEPEIEKEVAAADRIISGLMKDSPIWRGSFTVDVAGETVFMDVFLELQPTPAFESQCFNFLPLVEINGQVVDGGISGSGGCTPALRKRGDNYYLSYEAYIDAGIAKRLTYLLLPLPGTSASPEAMSSADNQWFTISGFRWQASTVIEREDVQNRYFRRLEDSLRKTGTDE